MDPSGLLDALLAAAVYPGGVFLVVAWLVLRATHGASLRPSPASSRDLVALLATAGAVMQLPLPGSPMLAFPGAGAAALDLLPTLILLAVAVDAGRAQPIAATTAAVAAGAVVMLASTRHTLDLASLADAGGQPASVARALIAVALGLAAAAGLTARRLAPVAATGLALAAAAAVVPAATGAVPVIASAALCLGVVAAIGGVSRVVPRGSDRWLALAGIAAGLVAAALLLSTGR